MLNLLLSFLGNVLIVMCAFCVTMLVFLWAIGKQKAAARRSRETGASSAAAEAARLRAEMMRPSSTEWHNSGDDNDGLGTRRSTDLPSAAVQRRLSFSAITPTPPAVRGGKGRDVERSRRRSFGNGTPGRRVTFSLTPEQQQNEYDKRASDSLARRRAAAVVADPIGESPLIELFPSNVSNQAPPVRMYNNSPYPPHILSQSGQGLSPRPWTYDRPPHHSEEVPAAPISHIPRMEPMAFRSFRDVSMYTPFVPELGNPFADSIYNATRQAPLIPTKRKQNTEALGRVSPMLQKRTRTVGDLNMIDTLQTNRERLNSTGDDRATRRRPPPVSILA